MPSNWRELPDSNSVTFAPVNGYGDYNGSSVFTHGIQIGLERNEAHDLRTATDELVDSLSRGNPRLSKGADYFNTTIDGRRGFVRNAEQRLRATGRDEIIQLITTRHATATCFMPLPSLRATKRTNMIRSSSG